jgi:hypothetical protein
MVSSQYGVELATTLVVVVFVVVDPDEVFEDVEVTEERLLVVETIEDVTEETPKTSCAMPNSNDRKTTVFIEKSKNETRVETKEC